MNDGFSGNYLRRWQQSKMVVDPEEPIDLSI